MTNEEVARLLQAIAAAYQIRNEKANRFKITAYKRAAASVEHSTSEIKDLWDDNKLNSIPGVGASIAQHLDELFRTGRVKHFEKVMKGLPKAMFKLLNIKGIGAKTAFKLCQHLGIRKRKNAVQRLKKAAQDGEIRNIPGFRDEIEKKILTAVKEFQRVGKKKKRMLLFKAIALAEEIIQYIDKNPAVIRSDPLGSLRRHCATVGDIDIAIATKKPKKVAQWLTQFPKIKRVLESGKKLISVVLNSGYQIDFRLHHPHIYGSLLQHFTGSKLHNIHLRELAIKKSLSLSEYGIKKLKAKSETRLRFRTEQKFYNYLGIDWIPPELREDKNEIEAAQSHNLPQLVKLQNVKGDLHIHSDFPVETSHDYGADSIDNLVKTAVKMEYQYLAFTEHNPSKSHHTDKDIIAILKRKKNYIEQRKSSWVKKLNIRVLNGLEIDIRPNGELAIPDRAFEYLDFAIAAVHSRFDMSRRKMTKRILTALSHPKVKILAHPTGRLLERREGYELDWDKIFAFCLKNDKILEINANPNRLDLPDILVREAVKNGAKLAINTDSHAKEQLFFMKYGVYVARRGWAEAKNIVNTLPLKNLCRLMGITPITLRPKK